MAAHGHRLFRGALFIPALLASVAALLATATGTFAQTDVPDAPTALAVYSHDRFKLEVRWSSPDAANTTSFKVQWKSGSEEYDTSRQETSAPAASRVPLQSTSVESRYTHVIEHLTIGTQYTVRVIATNANGDSAPSSEATGIPTATLREAGPFVEAEVVEYFESSNPWLRETWDYIEAQNVSVGFRSEGAAPLRLTAGRWPTCENASWMRSSLVTISKSGGTLPT